MVTTSRLLPLAPLVQRQFGAFTTEQAREHGLDRRRLSELHRHGEVRRLHRGVYAASLFADTWQQRWMAALLAAGAHAAISHLAAAHLHRLEFTGARQRPDLEIVLPRHRTLTVNEVRRLHTAVHLTPADLVTAGSWTVTSVPWTLCSLAHRLGVARTVKAVDAAIAANRLTVDTFGEVVVRFRYCPGIVVLREVTERLLPEVRLTRSDAERMFLRLLAAADLPLPEANVRVVDAAGHRRYLDFAYREERVAIEIDVHDAHLRAIGRNRDGFRQNDLVAEWIVLRFDELDLRFAPQEVVRQVGQALRAAHGRADGSPV